MLWSITLIFFLKKKIGNNLAFTINIMLNLVFIKKNAKGIYSIYNYRDQLNSPLSTQNVIGLEVPQTIYIMFNVLFIFNRQAML